MAEQHLVGGPRLWRPRSPRPPRSWSVARLMPLVELSQWGRLISTLTMLGFQVFLVTCLWRALYADTTVSAGLTADQAVTFAVLAVLHMRIRWSEMWFNPDAVIQHVRTGTILYWYLRPMPPQRYYLIRTAGDLTYGATWALLGYGVCLGLGVAEAPASGAAGLAAAVSLLIGQVILYYLKLAVDLLCFWTVMNSNAVNIYRFIQSLLSGTFAPLWYFPAWFVAVSAWLPFQGILNVPLSLYVGRLPLSEVPHQLAVQLGWCLLMAVITRVLWWRASRRVIVQGG